MLCYGTDAKLLNMVMNSVPTVCDCKPLIEGTLTIILQSDEVSDWSQRGTGKVVHFGATKARLLEQARCEISVFVNM